LLFKPILHLLKQQSRKPMQWAAVSQPYKN
jgi:hypothetical protein